MGGVHFITLSPPHPLIPGTQTAGQTVPGCFVPGSRLAAVLDGALAQLSAPRRASDGFALGSECVVPDSVDCGGIDRLLERSKPGQMEAVPVGELVHLVYLGDRNVL